MRERAAILAWVTVCIVWGTTYLAIKIALESLPPLLMGGIRFVLAGSTVLIWLLIRGALPPRHLLLKLAATGGLLLGIGNGGVVIAEQWVPSGLAAVVIATTPFWMVGVETMRGDHAPLSRRRWIGLALGFTGILLLVWPDLVKGGTGGWRFALGLLSLQVACAGWSLGSSISRRFPREVSTFRTMGAQMLFGGLWMLTAGSLLGEWRDISFSLRSTLALLYLTFIGGLAGFGAYMYALSRLPVSLVSLYTYVNPIIAVTLGTLVLGEPFNARMALAILVVLSGMALVTTEGTI